MTPEKVTPNLEDLTSFLQTRNLYIDCVGCQSWDLFRTLKFLKEFENTLSAEGLKMFKDELSTQCEEINTPLDLDLKRLINSSKCLNNSQLLTSELSVDKAHSGKPALLQSNIHAPVDHQ